MAIDALTWIGKRVAGNRYEVRDKLGEGGMALVYRAWDMRLQTHVVLKVPKPELMQEPGFAGRFAREIRALVHLVHPRIVRVTDAGTYAGLPFAVLQYLSGGTLDDRRPQAPDGRQLPTLPEGLRGWLGEVAEALDFIHGKGYVHRDVKPGNILFDENGNVFLGDFGIVKAASSDGTGRTASTTLGVVLGTPGYMAPEQFTGKPCDNRSDQYALAVTVYEILVGRGPFGDTSATVVLERQRQGFSPLLQEIYPTVPRALANALHRGMARDP